MSIEQIHPSIIGAIIGGLIGAVSSFILGGVIFYRQLNKERNFLWLQKIEQIFILTNKLLHRLHIILKSNNNFFLEPEKYYQRAHPEGEYFENYGDYFDYKISTNDQIFELEFYENFELLKSYILIFLPSHSEKIIQIENKILEINPMLHVARDVDSDYFKNIKQYIESISIDISNLNSEVLSRHSKLLPRNKCGEKGKNFK